MCFKKANNNNVIDLTNSEITVFVLGAALYNAAVSDPNIVHMLMTEKDAEKHLEQHGPNWTIVGGKQLHIILKKIIDVAEYNRRNGTNLAQKVFTLLEQGNSPESREIRTAQYQYA